MSDQYFDRVQEAAGVLRDAGPVPDVAVVLGSGLGDFCERLTDTNVISYEQIPHWPASRIVGHAGKPQHGLLPQVLSIDLGNREIELLILGDETLRVLITDTGDLHFGLFQDDLLV